MVNLGVSLAGNSYIYIYIIHRNQRPIWVSLMWILEKYNDITLKRGIANLGRSHRLPCVLTISMNFHKPMSVQYIFSIAGVFAVAQMELPCGWKKSWTSRRTLVTTQTTNPSQRSCFTNSPNIHYIKWLSQELNKYIYIYTYSYSNHIKNRRVICHSFSRKLNLFRLNLGDYSP